MGDNVYAIVTVVYGGSYIKDRLHANFDGGGVGGGEGGWSYSAVVFVFVADKRLKSESCLQLKCFVYVVTAPTRFVYSVIVRLLSAKARVLPC